MWTVIATQSSTETARSELEAFIDKCKDCGIPPHEVVAKRNTILKLWVDPDWNTAKKNHPHWVEKTWWEKRYSALHKGFPVIIKEIYADDLKITERSTEKTVEKTVEEPFIHKNVPLLTNLEDIIAWRARKTANGNG